MALHENFSEYTNKEISEIKKNVCAKHKCIYYGGIGGPNKKLKGEDCLMHKCCNYFEYTGKLRGCMPDECKHWKDKKVEKKRWYFFSLENQYK